MCVPHAHTHTHTNHHHSLHGAYCQGRVYLPLTAESHLLSREGRGEVFTISKIFSGELLHFDISHLQLYNETESLKKEGKKEKREEKEGKEEGGREE